MSTSANRNSNLSRQERFVKWGVKGSREIYTCKKASIKGACKSMIYEGKQRYKCKKRSCQFKPAKRKKRNEQKSSLLYGSMFSEQLPSLALTNLNRCS